MIYLNGIRWLISRLINLKQPRPSKLQKLGVGGIIFLIAAIAFLLGLIEGRRYQLVLREKPLLLYAPAAFNYAAVIFVIVTILWLWCLTILYRKKIGWKILSGKKTNELSWESVLLFVIPAVTVFTLSAGTLINCAFDFSPLEIHQSKIAGLYAKKTVKGGCTYQILLTDWKSTQWLIPLNTNEHTFQTRRVGEQITVKTKRGTLGYEWVVDFY